MDTGLSRDDSKVVIADLIRNPQRRATLFEAWIPACAGMTARLSLRT
jgi:hypothetical protein